MDHFDLVQSFLEQRALGKPIEELARHFQSAVHCLGVTHYACGMHVDPLKPPRGTFIHHNYPLRWSESFSRSRLYRIDPVLKYAERNHQAPFFWNEDRFLRQLEPSHRIILAAAATLGIRHGFTIPIRTPGSHSKRPASCSFVLDASTMNEDRCFAVQLLASSFFDAARGAIGSDRRVHAALRLGPLEHKCLELGALGFTDWEISELLMVSEATVQTHMGHAMNRLGTPTRWQAIAQAVGLRLVRFGDIPGIEETSESRAAYDVAHWVMLLNDDEVDEVKLAHYARLLAGSPAHAEALKFFQLLWDALGENSGFQTRWWHVH